MVTPTATAAPGPGAAAQRVGRRADRAGIAARGTSEARHERSEERARHRRRTTEPAQGPTPPRSGGGAPGSCWPSPAPPLPLRHLKPDDVALLAAELDADEYFPVSAKSGKGIPELLDGLFSVLPEGEWFYPESDVSDVPEEEWIAELVREELLRATRDELPYSIATRVTEWEWPRVRCEIVVERESQKGMVIGKGGALLKQVGEAVRKQMKPGAFLELHVTVDKNWQQRADRVERLGY